MAESQTADALLTAVVEKLGPLQYPQMARIARVTGDVRLVVNIRADGTVVSADVTTTSSPFLTNAAVASARNSSFLCQGCEKEPKSYSLTYTFKFRDDLDCRIKRTRERRCLYLWKCGEHQLEDRTETSFTPGHIVVSAGTPCVEVISSRASVTLFRGR